MDDYNEPTFEDIKNLLRVMSKYDVCDELYWTEELEFFINCNDVFFWGTADAEEITPEDIPTLEKALDDAGFIDGPVLYCARKRKMRPQGRMYKHFERENWELFDGCGPERDPSDPGNTPKP